MPVIQAQITDIDNDGAGGIMVAAVLPGSSGFDTWRSLNGGLSWTRGNTDGSRLTTMSSVGVAWHPAIGNWVLVASSAGPNNWAYSVNGNPAGWTIPGSSNLGTFIAVCAAEALAASRFVALYNDSVTGKVGVCTNADGTQPWVSQGLFADFAPTCIRWDATIGYVVGTNIGTARQGATLAALLASADHAMPAQWGAASTVTRIAAHSGKMIAVGLLQANNNGVAASSTDGINWTYEDVKFPAAEGPRAVCFTGFDAGHQYCAVGDGGAVSTRNS